MQIDPPGAAVKQRSPCATLVSHFPDSYFLTTMMQYFDARQATPQEVVAAIQRDGACVVTHLIPAADADAVVAEMRPYFERTTTGNDSFAGLNTTRSGALAARSPTFNRAVLKNKFFRAAADATLLPWCKRYQLMASQLIRIGPNSPAQPWHRDRQAWGTDLLGEKVEPQLASVWALTDFTVENGATRAVPGTHVRPLNYEYQPTDEEISYAEMPKGSAIFYTGSVLHSGGANVTKGEWRHGMHVSFACGWLRQEENQYLSVPPEVARTLDPEIQELLGYSLGVFLSTIAVELG